MQETVAWDLESVHVYLPWETKLYVLYLLFVIAISLVKVFGLLRKIKFFSFAIYDKETADSLDSAAPLKTQPKEIPYNTHIYLWEICLSKIQQLKGLAILNLFFGILMALLLTAKALNEMTTTKIAGIFFIAGIIQEILAPLALGVLISTAMYAFCIFYEGILARRKAAWIYFRSQAQSET